MLAGCVVYVVRTVCFDVVDLTFECFFSLPREFFLGISLIVSFVLQY